MKKYIIIILFLTFIITASGCIDIEDNNQTQGNTTYSITDKDSNTKHYDDNEISFDYPDKWNLSAGKYSVSLFNGKKQVTIEKPAITAAYQSENISTKKVSATIPLPVEIVSNETINVDGVNAQKIVYKSKGDSEPSRIEISVDKNGKLYKIYCHAPPDEFNSAQTDFNVIISSLKLK